MKSSEKVKLYILSLAILFLIVFIMSLKMPDFNFELCKTSQCDWSDWVSLLLNNAWLAVCSNTLPAIMFFCILLCVKIKHDFDYMLNGGAGASIIVRSVKSEDYEHLTFLATYIIPFFGFTFDDPRRLIAYFILLVVIGLIFIRTDKYYANPTLALFGFKLYKANLADHNRVYESVIIISQDVIEPNKPIKYKLISENVFFAKKIIHR